MRRGSTAGGRDACCRRLRFSRLFLILHCLPVPVRVKGREGREGGMKSTRVVLALSSHTQVLPFAGQAEGDG